MKVLYIESERKDLAEDLSDSEISKLPKKIFLVYTIQYKSLAENIKKQLEKHKIIIDKFQQVLGCTKLNLNNKTDLPILLIGTGRFHATNLFTQTSEIYLLENNRIIKIPKEEIEKLKQKRKTAYIKFLKADNIGILVSTKPGQENLEKAIKLKNNLKKQKKQAYIFLSNNIDANQFENFNIDSWVNTACPGLPMDNPDMINISEINNI